MGGGGCCVGNCGLGNSYCTDDSNLTDEEKAERHAKQITAEIENMKNRAVERAKNLEQDIIRDVNQSTIELAELLKPLVNDEEFNRLSEQIQNFSQKFISEIDNSAVGKMESRLVANDKELAVIMAETDRSKRTMNSDAFYEKIFRNATRDIMHRLESHFQNKIGAIDQITAPLEIETATNWDDVKAQIQNKITEQKNIIFDKLKSQIMQSQAAHPITSIRLIDIARKLNFDIAGNHEIEISSLKYAREADENSLAVGFTDKEILNTAAMAVLTVPRILPAGKTFLYCDFGSIGAAITKVAKILIKEGIYPDYEKPVAQTMLDNSMAMVGKNFVKNEGTDIAAFVSIGDNVTLGKNCKIESGVYIGSGTCIGDNVIIRSGTRIGVNCHYHYEERGKQKSFSGVGRVFISDNVEIGSNTVIQRGTLSNTIIGAGTIIGNLVEIAHDVKIGANCLIVSQVGICGNAEIGNGVKIYGQVGVNEWLKIGDGATVISKTRVTKNIRSGEIVSGMFSRPHDKELKLMAKLEKLIKGA